MNYNQRGIITGGYGWHGVYYSVEPNAEPSPSFDIDINKEDKDQDVDKPSIHKDPLNNNSEEEEENKPEKS